MTNRQLARLIYELRDEILRLDPDHSSKLLDRAAVAIVCLDKEYVKQEGIV